MAAFPCLPLWTDAYLADTQHLTTEEHGAYLLLLIQAWRTPTCALPDDDDMLARHAKLSKTRWKVVKPIVMALWKHDRKRKIWVQKRLRNEREKAAVKKGKARESALNRWNNRNSGDANAYADASSEQCSPEPSPPSKAKAFSGRASAQNPKGFVEVRKTTHAINDLIKEIRNDAERIGDGSESLGGDVPMLPAVRTG